MHKCSYTQEFRMINGKLTLCATAYWKNRSLECYRRDEENIIVRNMMYKPMAGYGVEFPGEHCSSYWYGPYTAILEEWGKPSFKISPYMGLHFPTAKEKQMVEDCYPGMKYVLAKADLTYSDILDIIPIWKKNPKVELLLAAGFHKLAFSKQFMNLKPETQKKYMKVLKGLENEDPSIELVRALAKGWTVAQFKISKHYAFAKWNSNRRQCTLEMARYLEKTGVDPQEYMDYRRNVEKVGHDLTDPYWSYPADFAKAHAKALRQVKNVMKQENAAKAKELQDKYSKAVKKYLNKVKEDNGLKVYVPTTTKEYNHHASVLHQCIVYNNYAEKVARGQIVLVFITKENKPYATAEIILGKKLKLGQFYGNERLKDYKARPDAVEAFNNWAKEFKIKVAA